jgi:aryl-alcohol dehydrogenase-like predicted oxidoreductase
MRDLGIRPFVATKIDVMPDQLDDIAAAVVANAERSLTRLQVDYIDVLQVHNAPTMSRRPPGVYGFEQMWVEDYLRPKGALEGLERLRRQGKVSVIGFTAESTDPEAVARLLRERCFGMIGLPYNLLNPSAGVPSPRGLQVARDFRQLIDIAGVWGVGVAVFGPVAMGVLSDRAIAGGERHPVGGGPVYADTARYSRDLGRATRLAFLSRSGQSLAQAATRFALTHPGVSTVVSGFSALEHVEEAASCSPAVGLSAVDMARIEMVWRSNFGESPATPA